MFGEKVVINYKIPLRIIKLTSQFHCLEHKNLKKM